MGKLSKIGKAIEIAATVIGMIKKAKDEAKADKPKAPPPPRKFVP
jgi:hypothetical protein